MIFKCSIPVDNHITKKNHMEVHRVGSVSKIGKSSALTVAEKILIQRLILAKLQSRLDQPIECDIQVKFTFHFKNYWTKPKNKKDISRRNKKLGDLSNLFQLPEDCLILAGIIADDQQICSYDGSRRLPGPENRLDIEISRLPYDLGSGVFT